MPTTAPTTALPCPCCGAATEPDTGLCPVCDAELLADVRLDLLDAGGGWVASPEALALVLGRQAS